MKISRKYSVRDLNGQGVIDREKCRIDFGRERRAESVCVNGGSSRKGGCGGGWRREGFCVDGSFGLLLVAAGIAGVHGWRFSGGDGDVQFLGFALAAMDSFVSKIGWCERDIRGGVLNGPFPVDFGKDVDAVAGVGGGDKDHVSI